jgi:hypothetical protein
MKAIRNASALVFMATLGLGAPMTQLDARSCHVVYYGTGIEWDSCDQSCEHMYGICDQHCPGEGEESINPVCYEEGPPSSGSCECIEA